jgi:hypothetical protein
MSSTLHARSPHRTAGSLRPALILALALALAAGGCGSSGKGAAALEPGTQGPGVPASAVAVIAAWADALRDGHPQRAAALWAHPSVMVNGPDSSGHLALIHIRSEHDALLADESLPCGATLRATARSGRYVRASFTLGGRRGPGAGATACSGHASVDFLISDGHIVRWLRAPSVPAGPPGRESGGSGVTAQPV